MAEDSEPARGRSRGEPALDLRRALIALAAVLLLGLGAVASYVGTLHRPSPHGIELGVVVPAAEKSLAQKEFGKTDALRLHFSTTSAEGRRRVARREDQALLIYSANGVRTDELLLTPAAGYTVAQLLPDLVDGPERAARRTVLVRDLVPATAADPRGLAPFFLVVAWCLGGFLAAAFAGVAGGLRSGSRLRGLARLGLLWAASIGLGMLGAVIVGPALHVIDTQVVEVGAVGVLVVFAVGAATAGLEALFGLFGTFVALAGVVVVGFPSADGIFDHHLLPTVPRVVSQYLPPGAGTSLVRSVVSFPDAPLRFPLAVLGAYAVVGLALALVGSTREQRSGLVHTLATAVRG